MPHYISHTPQLYKAFPWKKGDTFLIIRNMYNYTEKFQGNKYSLAQLQYEGVNLYGCICIRTHYIKRGEIIQYLEDTILEEMYPNMGGEFYYLGNIKCNLWRNISCYK